MTLREIMKRLSKLRNDQLDQEGMVYFRDLDRYFEVERFEISKGNDYLEEEQAYMVI
jgi:hypothetical protein